MFYRLWHEQNVGCTMSMMPGHHIIGKNRLRHPHPHPHPYLLMIGGWKKFKRDH